MNARDSMRKLMEDVSRLYEQTLPDADDEFGEGYKHGSNSVASASNKMEKKRKVAIQKAKRLMRDTGCSAEHAAKEYDLLPGDVVKLKGAEADKKSFSDMTPDEIDRLPKNKHALGDLQETRQLAGLSESAYAGTVPTEPEERVNFSQTKRVGDSTVTVSADAQNMAELHQVLKMAGIDVEDGSDPAIVPTEQPEVDVLDIEPQAAASASPDTADYGCDDVSYSTDKDQIADYLRQQLQNSMRGDY